MSIIKYFSRVPVKYGHCAKNEVPKILLDRQGTCRFPEEMKPTSLNQTTRQMLSGSLFISGWAGYQTLFPAFSKQARFVLPFIDCSDENLEPVLSSHWKTVFAWSLGAHLCLKNLNRIRADRLVLIAPFLDFCQGTSRERIKDMLRGLDKNPRTTVRWFWKACSVRQLPGEAVTDVQNLKKGLEFLIHSRISPESLNREMPVTLIHGRTDRIVPARLSQRIKKCLPQACYHLLPYGHFIPETEIIKIAYEKTDPETF